MTRFRAYENVKGIDRLDELELEPELVADLEVDQHSADAVRGGPGASGHSSCIWGA